MNKEQIRQELINSVITAINYNHKDIISEANKLYLNSLNGLGYENLSQNELDNWNNQIYKFDTRNLIDTRLLDDSLIQLLEQMFSIYINNKTYMTYISRPRFYHHTDHVSIDFNYCTNINYYIDTNYDNINNTYNNIHGQDINKEYLYDHIQALLTVLSSYNDIDTFNNSDLNHLLSNIYNKKIKFNAILVNNINNDDDLYIKAYKQFKYNDSINNTNIISNKINTKVNNSFIEQSLYNPSKIDDQYINNIGDYYTQVYNNISEINNLDNLTAFNILNNTNIDMMDNTMTNKYKIGIIHITKGKGANISAIGRTEYNKSIKGSFINYSSKSHIKTIYNNKGEAYNTFTSLRNINSLNYKANNTLNNNTSIIFAFGIEGLKYRTSFG